MFVRVLAYLGSRQGLIATSIVCLSGLLFGHFMFRTYLRPLPASYKLNFGASKWIQPPDQTEGCYYRKDLYIPELIEKAWIAIAATGSYELVVNNVIVDANQLPDARPSGLYDITRLLVPGKNAIGVFVSGEWWTERPQIRVRGAYYLIGKEEVELLSDSLWKVSAVGSGVPGKYSWSAPGLDVSAWPSAIEGHESERYSTVQRLDFDPRTIEASPIGRWVSDEDQSSREITFSRQLTLDARPLEAWLQLASNGTYDVVVNDQLAILAPGENQALLFSASAPVILANRVFSASEMPRLFGPSSGLPGTKVLFSAVSQPRKFSPHGYVPGLQQYTSPGFSAGPLERQPSTPGADSLPSFKFSTSSSALSSLPRAPTGSGEVSPQPGWNPRLLQDLDLPSATTISIPVNPSTSPLALPSLGDIVPEPAPAVPQLTPMGFSPGPEASAALVFTGYDISELLHSGNNSIRVRVRAFDPPAALLVSGFVDLAGGDQLRFGSGPTWTVSLGPIGEGKPATVVGEYWSPPWGPPVQAPAARLRLPGQDVTFALDWILSLTAATLFMLVAWLIVGCLAGPSASDCEDLWNCDAILHLPLLLAMAGCLLLSYDVRVSNDWCFRPCLIVILVCLFLTAKLASIAPPTRARSESASRLALPSALRRAIPWAVLIGLTMVGLAIRIPYLSSVPLGHDEVELALYSRGISTTGFPHMIAGSYYRLLSTYELIPYPMAFFHWLLGRSLPWYRLPSLVFGTLTISLIGWVGYRMFDWRVGLTAALIWAFLPIPVNWSADGFYPSQEIFLALSSVWLFYEAIRKNPIGRGYLTASAMAFLLAYFSWEATGFMLFALFAGLVAMRKGDRAWLRDGHLWRCFAAITIVVVLQLCFRQLTLIPDYLGFIRDLSQLTTPAFVPLDRLVFDPFYYLKVLFFAENEAVLTVLSIAGLLLAKRNKALLYLDVLLVVLYASYTLFLDHYAPRYCLTWLPLLVLSAAGSLFCLFDRAREIGPTGFSRGVAMACSVVAVLLLAGATNQYVLKLFRIASDPTNPVYFDRMGVRFKANYADADRYVASHLMAGDVVVTRAPHVFLFTTGRRPDYCFDPRLTMRVFYDGGQTPPGYIDKWLGVRQLRTLEELKDVQAHSHRVWIIADMTHSLDEAYTQEVNNYLMKNGSFAYESAAQRVILLSGVAPD
jgi:hypothetical protein